MKNVAFWVMSVSAIVSAKWAMELGFNQFRQLLWMIAGFFLGPLALLVLYVRMLYKQQDDERRAREMARAEAEAAKELG